MMWREFQTGTQCLINIDWTLIQLPDVHVAASLYDNFVNQASVYVCPKQSQKRISNTLICRAVQRCLAFQTVGIDSAAVYPSCLSCLSFFYFRFSNKYRGLIALWESISVYIEPFPRERKDEKEDSIDDS